MLRRFLNLKADSEDATFVANVLRPRPEGVVAPLPDALLDWLVDLALLKHVPFEYLVPDPDALPPESLRFFYVDNTWIEALIDGALAAGNVGILDQHLSRCVMEGVRKQVYTRLRYHAFVASLGSSVPEPPPPSHLPVPLSGDPLQMTGFLLRSAAVRRWPEMKVRGYSARSKEGIEASGANRVPILRRAQLSPSLMLVLFAGAPLRVELEEPAQGLQFGVDGLEYKGVDGLEHNKPYVKYRQTDGREPVSASPLDVGMSDKRRLEVSNIGEGRFWVLPDGVKRSIGPGLLSLQLQQLPWCQVFQRDSEAVASQPPAAPPPKATPTRTTTRSRAKRTTPDPEEE